MKITHRWTLAFVLLCGASAFAQTDAILPQVAEGTFADGSFRMTFVLVNNGDVASVATITLTDNNGAPLQLTIPGLGNQSIFVVNLEAGGTRLLQTAGSGALRTGAARVTSAQSIGVSAIFSVYDSEGRFLTEAGVGNSSPGTEFVIPVDTTGNFNTGAAFFNSGGATANLTIRLLDGTGTQTMMANDALQPAQQKARFFAGPGQIFPTATNFRGTAVVTSSSPIAAVVLRQNSTPLSYTSLPAVPRAGGKTQINLSQVANGTFERGSFGTTFTVFNTSAAQANVTVTLARGDGTPFSVTIVGRGTASVFNLALQPGGSAFLETDGKGALTAGSAVITSNVPIGASAIFTVFDLQGRFLTEAGVGDAAALTELTLPVDISATTDTGIAFFNPNNATITLTIRLLDSAGATVATTELTLGARGQTARFATQFFPGHANFRGSIGISSAGGGVAAITLRQIAAPLTYTTLPVLSGRAKVGTPPAPLPLLTRTLTGMTFTADTTLDQTLQAGFKISGNINAAGTITAVASDGRLYSVLSLFPGPYQVVVPTGNYELFVCHFSGTVGATLSLYHGESSPVQVTGDTSRNINVVTPALFNVSGTVSGIAGPLTGSNLSVVFYNEATTHVGTFTLGGGGAYQGQLPSGTWNVSLTSIAQLSGGRTQFLGLYNLGTVTVSGSPVSANFAVPPLANLSGTVRIPGLASLPSTTLAATDISAAPTVRLTGQSCGIPSFGSSIHTETSGAYQLPLVAARTYDMAAYAQIVSSNPVIGNVGFPVNLIRREVSGNTALDINFPALPPLVTVSGRVTGPNGQPAAKVQVNVDSMQITGAPDASYAAVTTADSGGNYRITVLSGTGYRVVFTPRPPLPQ